MGGPAMIEGGGLGVLRARGGRADRRAGRQRRRRPARRRRRARRSPLAKRYLSYFRGAARARTPCPTRGCCASWSRRSASASTTCARSSTRCSTRARCSSCAAASAPGWSRRSRASRGGRSGVVANDPAHLGGAIDADAADKAARFMQLCDAFGLPVLFLCDTPGLHGRPRRRAHRDGAPLRAHVPRRREPDACPMRHDRAAQGLRPRRAGDGRRAASRRRCSPSPGRPRSSAAMGLEGAVRLGMRRELEAIEDERGARAGLRGDRRRRLRARTRPEHGRLRRDRRRDRPGRLAPLDRDAVRRSTPRLVASGRARSARTSTPGEPRPAAPVVTSARARRSATATRRDRYHRRRPSPGTLGMDLRQPHRHLQSRRYPQGTGPKPMSHPTDTIACA